MTKEEQYIQFVDDYKRLISGETEEVSAMANTSAAIHDEFHFFWVGFYIVKADKLILGPFQGPVACSTIRFGKGVCGTAWKEQKTQVVPDVEQFPGHIACSSLSRSEIVVPVFANNEVKAVLDIDSTQLNTFDAIDRKYLEQVASILADTIYNKE
ncbi:GAF domain-containing protein [Phocaeicola oris]|uniref:GAF domain-containing protein n=1 Tax=Phocaeicola oris TaxID=2896850 RepID=UPI00234F7143|nr:GAF domain-containing protein [Phocaeicola oris]MCE2615334.1 GAF domain-containing protein [Phocaeicola oris]